MTSAALTLVCSTVGRPTQLRRLLESVKESEAADRVEFVLIDQDPDRACTSVLADMAMPGPVQASASGRGISAGRNAGIALATGDIVGFPNDNSWYPPETLRAVTAYLNANPSVAGLSGRMVTADGVNTQLRWPARPACISRKNIARAVIATALFLRKSVFDDVATFDESIGAGSPGIVGAGEESDLVLRLIAAGHRLKYRPEIRVFREEPADRQSRTFAEKNFRYGAGQGNLWRRHHLARHQLAYWGTRKLVKGGILALRGEFDEARGQVGFVRGIVAGYRNDSS